MQNRKLAFVDVAQRKAELAQLDQGTRDTWCDASALDELDLATHVVEIPPVITEETRGVLSPMFRMMLYGRIAHDYLDNKAAGKTVARTLHHWARSRALLNTNFLNNNQGVRLDLWYGVQAYMLAWESVQRGNGLSKGQRAEVDYWLAKLLERLRVYLGEEEGGTEMTSLDISNQAVVQDLNQMLFGIYTGDNIRFQRAIKRYFAVLDGLVRADGSFVDESQRGGTALTYQVGSTATMIRIAELAANQGYNLYDVEVDGVSLLDIIDFTLDGLEDPSIFNQYTQHQNPEYCSPEVCARWNDQDYVWEPWGFSFAEIEVLKRRFPGSALARRIEDLFPESTYTPVLEGPLLQTCEYRSVN